jgi:hypothetical protein
VAQNTPRKHAGALVPWRTGGQDGLGWWVAPYLRHAVTTRPASQQVQHRDLGLLLRSLQSEEGTDQRRAPRLARTFQQHLRQTLTPEGHRAWSDKTIQRILTHLKTFTTWGHTHEPFPLGPPMAAITLSALGTGLEVDRALTAAERRRLLNAADLLLVLDALDDAATEALRRAVRGKSASGGCREGRDTQPNMALDMANHRHY